MWLNLPNKYIIIYSILRTVFYNHSYFKGHRLAEVANWTHTFRQGQTKYASSMSINSWAPFIDDNDYIN